MKIRSICLFILACKGHDIRWRLDKRRNRDQWAEHYTQVEIYTWKVKMYTINIITLTRESPWGLILHQKLQATKKCCEWEKQSFLEKSNTYGLSNTEYSSLKVDVQTSWPRLSRSLSPLHLLYAASINENRGRKFERVERSMGEFGGWEGKGVLWNYKKSFKREIILKIRIGESMTP